MLSVLLFPSLEIHRTQTGQIGQGTALPALSRAGRLDVLKIPPNLSPPVFLFQIKN